MCSRDFRDTNETAQAIISEATCICCDYALYTLCYGRMRDPHVPNDDRKPYLLFNQQVITYPAVGKFNYYKVSQIYPLRIYSLAGRKSGLVSFVRISNLPQTYVIFEWAPTGVNLSCTQSGMEQ